MKKRFLIVFVLTCVLATAFAGIAYARAHEVIVVNSTGIDIYAVYVSPSQSNVWGSDLLGGDILWNGYEFSVILTRYSSSWDIKVVDKYGRAHYWYNQPLSDVYRVTLYRY